MARYERSTELRKVAFYDMTSLADILEADWRTLFYLIPRRIEHVDKPASSYALKYNGAQEKELEKYAGKNNECARQLLDEWGSSGKKEERPTLDHLLRLLVKGGMFRAADELAVKLLKEDAPSRPSAGPAAPINVEEVLKREIERGLDQVAYPNSELLNRLQSSTVDNNLDGRAESKREDVRNFPLLVRDSMMDGSLPTISESDGVEEEEDVEVGMPNISALLRSVEQSEPMAGPSGLNPRPNGGSFVENSDSYNSDSQSDDSSSGSTVSGNQSVYEVPSVMPAINEEDEPANFEGGLPNLSIFGTSKENVESSSSGMPHLSELMNAANISTAQSSASTAFSSRSSIRDSFGDSSQVASNDTIPPVHASPNLMSDLIKFSLDSSAVVSYPYTSLVLATAYFDNQRFQNGDLRHPDGRLLGQGGFGEVYLGLNLTSTAPAVAVKRLFPTNYKYREKFDRERDILSKYNHPNIVKLLGHSDDSQLCLVYEFMPDGNLDGALKACLTGPILPAARRLNYLLGIASAIDYLHNAQDPLIHRDVTPSNILLHGEVAKLGDFGLVKRVESTTATVLVGTGPYLSLEALRGTITPALDVYSFGVVMAQVVTAEDVISESITEDQDDLLERISSREGDFSAMVDRNVRPEETGRWLDAGKRLLELSNRCLLERAKQRPTARVLYEQIREIHCRACMGLNGCVG